MIPTATQDIWLGTAIVIDKTVVAATEQSRNAMATQAAQFPIACEKDHPINEVSPDGNWLASTCGFKRDQSLIVQNKTGTKWVLEFKDFLSSETIRNVGGIPMGSLRPKFWSPDGAYLYFTTAIGYDGGGDQCFTRALGDYGLFRLDLKNGEWATLIPPTDLFPGFGATFSSTGRRYAANMDANRIIMITDLKTGEVSRINLDGTIEGVIWSPDGTQLAFTVASCNDNQGTVQSSSVYVWNALKNEKHILFTTNEMVLSPEVWIDNSTFRIIGDKFVDRDVFSTIYVFDSTTNNIVFTGTTTPYPN